MAKSPADQRTISQIELIDKYVSEGWENRLAHCQYEQVADQAIDRIGSETVHRWGRNYFDGTGHRALVWKYKQKDGHEKLVLSYLVDDHGVKWIPLPRGY